MKHNYSIHNRLFAYSTFLTLAVMITLYFILQQVVSTLIVQKQADFDINSFKQDSKYYKSIFENVEDYIQKISTDKAIAENITRPYDKYDYGEISEILDAMNSEMNNIIVSKINYIDSIIVIGANNFVYVYSMENSSRYLGDGFDFHSFQTDKNLSAVIRNNGMPFYFTMGEKAVSTDNGYDKVDSIIKNKIIYSRTLKYENSRLDGLVIFTFKSTMISDIMPKAGDYESLGITDGKGNTIWYTGSRELTPPAYGSPSDTSGYAVINRKDGAVLETFYKIAPYNFRIIKRITLQHLFKSSRNIRLYTLLFGLFSFLLVMIFSYIFSNKVSKPLDILAGKLAADSSVLIQAPEVELKVTMNNLTLRTKIIMYFILLVILPNMIYASLMTFLYYETYRDKIIDITSNSIEQAKRTINSDIRNYDQMILQTAYSDTVQTMLNKPGKKALTQSEINKLDQMLLGMKMAKKDFSSLSIIDMNGNSLYAGSINDVSMAAAFTPDSLSLMNKSGGKFILLGAKKDMYMNDVLCFGRLIYGSGMYFGKKLGYIMCFINTDVLENAFQTSNLGNSRYIFSVDENGSDLFIDSEDVNSTIIQSGNYLKDNNLPESFLQQVKRNPNGLFAVRCGSRDSLVIYNTLDMSSLKIIGIIPDGEISSKVLPLILYSAFILALYIIVIMLISALISSSITSPLRKLQSYMGEVNNENFDVHMNYAGKDEIGILSNQFNNMVIKLKELIYENYQSKLRESELLFLEKEAQLNALQQQINPHFLYNILESIKWMAYKKGVMEICNMTTALGKFLRGNIVQGSDFITVAEEIEHLKNYIYIQQIRYKGKFDVIWDVEGSVLEHRTLKLVFQPIVENAITHGLESYEEGGLIKIKGYMAEDRICFEFTDNGVGMSGSELEKLLGSMVSANANGVRTSIGLTNVYRRLKLHFGGKCDFMIQSEEGKGTSVKFTIPISADIDAVPKA